MKQLPAPDYGPDNGGGGCLVMLLIILAFIGLFFLLYQL